MAKNEYLMRHDRVGAHLHYSKHKALGIKPQKNGTHTHTPKPIYEHKDVTVLWNIKRCTQIGKLWLNRPHTEIKSKEKMHTDTCGKTSKQKYHARGSTKENR